MDDDRGQAEGVTRGGLEALHDKYREMERLRRAQDAGETPDPPRAAMAALARRFPGALRELDELPMDALQRRLEALRAALGGAQPAPDWARVQLAYHGFMRVCLRAKRLAASESDHAAVAARLRASEAQPGDPPADSLDPDFVARALKPPGGRLNPWCFASVAEQLGLSSPDDVRGALFKR